MGPYVIPAQEDVKRIMEIKKLDDQLATSSQIAAGDLEAVAAAGYRAVLSNRPDGEAEGQPTAAEIAEAAKAAGLAFAHVPVIGSQISEQDIADFRQALDVLPRPVFGFCRTGTRTTMMWALAQAGTRTADDLISTAATAGYDLSGMRTRLEGAS